VCAFPPHCTTTVVFAPAIGHMAVSIFDCVLAKVLYFNCMCVGPCIFLHGHWYWFVVFIDEIVGSNMIFSLQL